MTLAVKRIFARCLPLSVQQTLRKIYYPGVVRRYRAEDWPCAPVVRGLIRPGDHVVDAGANIGYLTALFSQWVGESGIVHSIEPVADTYALLAHNVSRLRLGNVRLYNCGVSDRDAERIMEIPAYPGGGENLYESRVLEGSPCHADWRTMSVRLRRLDTLLADVLDRISFVKVDVEAHELFALRGAQTLLDRVKPSFLIEVSGDPDEEGTKAQVLFRLMASAGYKPYVIVGGSLKPRDAMDRAVDYLFLQEVHIKQFTN